MAGGQHLTSDNDSVPQVSILRPGIDLRLRSMVMTGSGRVPHAWIFRHGRPQTSTGHSSNSYGFPFRSKMSAMTKGLVRYQQCGCFHFITFSCYRWLPYLRTAAAQPVAGTPALLGKRRLRPEVSHRPQSYTFIVEGLQ